MNTVLVLLNEGASHGRSEKFHTRGELLPECGWEQDIVLVPVGLTLSLFVALYRVVKRARREDIDVIHSINNPFHIHLVALIASSITGLPWLAEFRDPLVTNPDVDPNSWRATARRTIERAVVSSSDKVAWLDMIQLPENYFQATYPEIPDERWLCLPPIGFKEELFRDIEPVNYDIYTITYAGSFYEGWIEPYSFLKGLKRYVDAYNDEILVQFYGDWAPAYNQYLEKLGIVNLVEHHEPVPHEEIVPILAGSDMLLYIGGSNERNSRNISSKIWDYIGARRPVLTVASSSFRVYSFVEDYGIGIAAEPSDPNAIANAIHRIRTGEVTYNPDESIFKGFTREANVTALAAAYDDLL